MNNRLKIAVLVSVVIILGAILFLVQSNSNVPGQEQSTNDTLQSQEDFGVITPSQTIPGWNTYTHYQQGFAFDYPADWELDRSSSNSDYPTVSAVSPEVKDGAKDNFGGIYSADFSVYYYDSIADEPENPGVSNLEDFIRNNSMISAIGPISLQGHMATEVSWGGLGVYYAILAERNNHIYKLWFANVWDKASLNDTHKQIISSFRFIDPDSNSQTYKDGQVTENSKIPGWSTFHSASRKFQISFPSDYEIAEMRDGVRFSHPLGWDEILVIPNCGEDIESSGFFQLDENESAFNGMLAKVYKLIAGDYAKLIRIASSRGCYTITANVKYTGKKLKELDPILNTFEYDKPNVDLSYEKDTGKWLTFKNDELGISFKYPPKYKADDPPMFVKGDTGEIFMGILRSTKCLNVTEFCDEPYLSFGGSTLDYSAPKGASGYEGGGYKKVGSTIVYETIWGNVEMPIGQYAAEIKGTNTVGVMITGSHISDPMPGWTPPTTRRAIFNLKSSRFPGISFINYDVDSVSEEEFIAILETIIIN